MRQTLERPLQKPNADTARRPRAIPLLALLLVLVWAVPACVGKSRWFVAEEPEADDVAELIGPDITDRLWSAILVGGLPEIPVRKNLRPCCAFGAEIQAELLGMPIPFYSIPNVLGPDDLGRHRYDSGVLSGPSPGERRPEYDRERNGLVYTCRGGFIDTAHVRDYLDWTAYLTVQAIAAVISQEERVIDLPDEGGKRRVRFRSPGKEISATWGPTRVAYWMAGNAAFQMSVWHEIATWFGWHAVKGFSERASAFSPEDLYSNGLGVRLTEALVLRRAAKSERLFNENADAWLNAALEMLGAVPKDVGREAASAVDGLWWDSKRRVPDPRLVLRRNFDASTPMEGWRVPPERAPESLQQACGDAEPFRLAGPERHGLAQWVTLEIEPDASIANMEPFPSLPDVITDEDFPELIEVVREQNRTEFGEGTDRPD